jgi:hypothetical protein
MGEYPCNRTTALNTNPAEISHLRQEKSSSKNYVNRGRANPALGVLDYGFSLRTQAIEEKTEIRPEHLLRILLSVTGYA